MKSKSPEKLHDILMYCYGHRGGGEGGAFKAALYFSAISSPLTVNLYQDIYCSVCFCFCFFHKTNKQQQKIHESAGFVILHSKKNRLLIFALNKTFKNISYVQIILCWPTTYETSVFYNGCVTDKHKKSVCNGLSLVYMAKWLYDSHVGQFLGKCVQTQ